MRAVNFFALEGIPSIKPGADLSTVILVALAANGLELADNDVVVLAQKIVSKSENRYVDLEVVTPSAKAIAAAEICRKDARLVELILRESVEIVRCVPNILIVRNRNGLVLANAGIDQSNLPDGEQGTSVLLLPENPDASAAGIRDALRRQSGKKVGVGIIDSLGRAWRIGTSGTLIGAAGIDTVRDMRGQLDLFGRVLQSTILGFGDELAAGASLVMGQASEGTPVVLIRGLTCSSETQTARTLVRPPHEDLFK